MHFNADKLREIAQIINAELCSNDLTLALANELEQIERMKRKF